MSPRTSKQNQELREKSREKILTAALDVFAHEGYHASSVSRVAKKAGVSKGLIYNYFESKEQMLEEALQHVNQSVELPEGLHQMSAREMLRTLFEYFAQSLEEHMVRWRLTTSLILQEDFEFVKKAGLLKFQAFEQFFSKAFSELKYEEPKAEARFLMAVFEGMALQKVILQENYSLQEAKEMLIKKYCSEK
jgi:AcrR family transcriptional regulator